MTCSLQFKIGALNLWRQSMLGQIGYDSTRKDIYKHTHTHTHTHIYNLSTKQYDVGK